MRAIDYEIAKKRLQAWIDESEAQGFEEAARNFRDCISLLDAVPTLTPPNEWVSVEERLPEKHSEYIVCACDEGEPIDERIWGDTVVVCADYHDGAFTWYEGNTEYDISDIVTHWMPLPAPPGKDNNVPAKALNEPLTCKGCMYAPDCPSEIHCHGCARMYTDHYRRPPEGEENV